MVVVAGTGTEVGKTWLACRLLECWRARGFPVAARKPAQSYDPWAAEPTDAERLAGASGEEPGTVCRPERWYPRPLAPPMAAHALGSAPFRTEDLGRELTWPAAPAAAGLVELAGGLGSPQASDGDGVDLVRALGPDAVVLVSGAGLGALSHVRMAARSLHGWPLLVFLNHFDPGDEVHRANREWLAEHWGLEVAVEPDELAGRLLPGE
jgi:dethiobiotin synthetase